MSTFDHSPEIISQAEWLEVIQRNKLEASIFMKRDEALQAKTFYVGEVEQVVVDTAEPYVDLRADEFVIFYETQAYRDAQALFSELRKAREDILQRTDAIAMVADDLKLMGVIEQSLGVERELHKVQLNGTVQRLALAAIQMVTGGSRGLIE